MFPVNVKPIKQDGAREDEEQKTIRLHDLRVDIERYSAPPSSLFGRNQPQV